MKKLFALFALVSVLICMPVQHAEAQDIIGIIKDAITKVIKAVDLQIQRIQTQTIWLQNAQKVLENTMSKLHLDDITGWVEKQRDLYAKYYDELWKVKSVITYYHRIKDISTKQGQIVSEYQRAWNLLRQDTHFSREEISYMQQVYTGILDQTAENIDQLITVINSFSTQMTDAKRLDIINKAADATDENYSDLKQFNTQNALLSINRAKDASEALVIKKLYGFSN